ncbi:hypothetical protein D779_0279 [Imhoffiella purpurea]|uniref:YhdP central domain-containing protein n=2 Tax=Imhoffiella purpurea TaxID=1249627 RepID=W9W193_9GAMM|nr:hypothetical protein D779_0279 [Imhoffiella purpurea]
MLALLMGTVNLLQPWVSGYADVLSRHLGPRLGYQVSIQGLGLSLSGLHPRLLLRRVRLSDPATGARVLALRAMELELDTLGSILTAAPRIDALTLIGARLVLRRQPDGRFELVGLGGLRSDDPKALALFLGQGRLALVDSELIVEDASSHGRILRLAGTRIDLSNDGRHHLAELSARLVPPHPVAGRTRDDAGDGPRVPSGDNRLHLIADLRGPPADLRAWSGRVYVRFDGSNLGLLLPPGLIEGRTLDTRGVSLEGWFGLGSGRLVQSLLRADLSGLMLSAGAGSDRGESFALSRASLLGRLRQERDGWRLEIADLNARIEGADLEGVDADLHLDGGGRVSRAALSVDRCDLSLLSGILDAGPWAESGPMAVLRDSRPSGELNALRLGGERSADGRWGWSASGSLRGLSLERHDGLPGFRGLDGAFYADRSGGELRLGSAALDLDLNPLFTLPLHLDAFSGRLDWRREPGGDLRLSARTVSLETADLGGRVRFDLLIPADGESPFLDLRANFSGDVGNVRPYLPAGIMHPNLIGWLERSIVSGRLAQGDATFRGRLADFPFRDHQGRFELLLDFEDLLLDYQKGWPPIRSAGGHLRFLDQGLLIQVDRGRIYDSDFSDGRAEIADLWGPETMRIHGEAEGAFADARRTLVDTPLAEDLGRLAETLAVEGRSRVALDIDLPLVRDGHLGVSGTVTWPGPASLAILGTPLELSNLEGELHFTGNSLSAEDIRARLWGRPLALSIETRKAGDAEGAATRIEARSTTPVSELARRLPSPLWRDLGGDLDWNLTVSLHNKHVSRGEVPLDFSLASDLRGLAIDLPPPLGKSAKSRGRLGLDGRLVPGRSLVVSGRIEDLAANLELALDSGSPRLVGGNLRLGAEKASAPEREGLFLDGSLDRLDLAPWTDLLASRAKQKTVGGDLPFEGARLRIGRLDLGDLHLGDSRLVVDPRDDGWRIALDANELSGRIDLPASASEGPVSIALERLDLAPLIAQLESSSKARDGAEERSASQGSRFSGLPSLDLRVTDLKWHGESLGTLKLDLRRQPEGVRLPLIDLDGGPLGVHGSAQWWDSGAGGRSRLGLSLETADLGALLERLDDKSNLEAGRSSAKLTLEWPGPLDAFSRERTDGSIALEVGKGRFPEVEPGLGRLLGFFNFSALGRRLALDFTDLYGQGFAFERMQGRISLGGGKARFEDFVIDGPAGKIMVAGESDLATQTFDQRVTVEPKLGSSVALASAVAGGPVVGAAVYLVDQVAGNPIDRLGRYRYRVTGPWNAPELKRLGWEPLGDQAGAEPSGDSKSGPPETEDRNLFLDVD